MRPAHRASGGDEAGTGPLPLAFFRAPRERLARYLRAALAELRQARHGPLPLALNSLALITAKVASLGLGFLAWVVAARLFAPAQVGLASGAVAAMMLCVQLAMLGVGSSLISMYPGHSRAPALLLDSAALVVAVAAVVMSLLFLQFASAFLAELKIVAATGPTAIAFVVLSALGALGVLLDQASTTLRRGDQALVRNVVGGGVTLVMLPVLAGLRDWFAIFVAWLVGGALMFGLGLVQLSRAIAGYVMRPRVSTPLARSLLSIGLPNWVLTLAERLPGTVMPIVVTELINPETNAYWYAIWMMAWVIYIVPIQVGLSLFAEASHRPDRLAVQIRQGIRISLLIGVAGAVVLAVLAHPILSLLKPVYADQGTDALRILLLAVIPSTFIQAYFAACRSTRRLPEAIVTGIVSGTIGVTAGAVAGRDHGLDHPLVWMAVAWVVSQTLTGVWAFWRLRRIVNSTPSSNGPATADGLLTA